MKDALTENYDKDVDEGTDEVMLQIGYNPECRICLESHGTLMEPCTCKGSSGYVHLECLNKWRMSFPSSHEKRNICEICKSPYTIPNPTTYPFGYLFMSIVLFSCTLSALVSGLCSFGPIDNERVDNIYCVGNVGVTMAHAAIATRLTLLKHKSDKGFSRFWFPQGLMILMVFALDGFHVFLVLINLMYFLYNFTIVVKPEKNIVSE